MSIATPPGRPDDAGPPRRRAGHRRRRAARRLAVELLYQADVMQEPPERVLESWREAGRDVPRYTEELVLGVAAAMPEIDARLGSDDDGWPIHRMPPVDRTILRVACHELDAGVPVPVAINEAVEAATELSTADSGRFVNGVLGRIARARDADADADRSGRD